MTSSKFSYRSELDGLRAISVISVVLFHAGFDLFEGGFVGVDIFFVISGYLITSIIAKEVQSGTFSLLNFYDRRIRRLLPALYCVFLATLPFALLWLFPHDFKNFLLSLVSASTFSSNIFFWRSSGYFATESELVPLLHTWSLSVEAQFYLFFPFLILLAKKLGFKTLVLFIFTAFLLSLLLSVYYTPIAPSAAFYLLPARGWELLAGSLVALFMQTKSFIGFTSKKILCECLSLIGIILICYSIFFLNENDQFPGIVASIPVFGTALILTFSSKETLLNRFLRMRILSGIGLISYSAYLWHFPLFVFAKHRIVPEPNQLIMVLMSATTFLLAYMSWRFVEVPFRNRENYSGKFLHLSLTGVLCFFICLSFLGWSNGGLPGRFESNFWEFKDRIFEHNYGLSKKCDESYKEIEDCVSSGDISMVLWGDSMAMSIAPALTQGDSGKGFRQHTLSACPPILNATMKWNGAVWQKGCIEQNDKVLSYIKANRSIDYVFLVSRFSFEKGIVSRDLVQHEYNEKKLISYFKNTYDALIKIGKKPLFVSPPPRAFYDVGRCVQKAFVFGHPLNSCDFPLSEVAPGYRKTASVLKEVEKFAPVFWLQDFLCPNGVCMALQYGVPIYRDYDHLTIIGASKLGSNHDLMSEFIKRANSLN